MEEDNLDKSNGVLCDTTLNAAMNDDEVSDADLDMLAGNNNLIEAKWIAMLIGRSELVRTNLKDVKKMYWRIEHGR